MESWKSALAIGDLVLVCASDSPAATFEVASDWDCRPAEPEVLYLLCRRSRTGDYGWFRSEVIVRRAGPDDVGAGATLGQDAVVVVEWDEAHQWDLERIGAALGLGGGAARDAARDVLDDAVRSAMPPTAVRLLDDDRRATDWVVQGVRDEEHLTLVLDEIRSRCRARFSDVKGVSLTVTVSGALVGDGDGWGALGRARRAAEALSRGGDRTIVAPGEWRPGDRSGAKPGMTDLISRVLELGSLGSVGVLVASSAEGADVDVPSLIRRVMSDEQDVFELPNGGFAAPLAGIDALATRGCAERLAQRSPVALSIGIAWASGRAAASEAYLDAATAHQRARSTGTGIVDAAHAEARG